MMRLEVEILSLHPTSQGAMDAEAMGSKDGKSFRFSSLTMVLFEKLIGGGGA